MMLAGVVATVLTPMGAGGPTPAELLQEAARLTDAFEYDRVIPVTEQVLASPDATLQQRLEAYVLHGSSLAVVGDTVEAEASFRLLLRADPEFELSADTPPRILAVFRKVQVEEQAIRDEMRALERERIIATLRLLGDHPGDGRGGLPVVFSYRLKDPRAVVEQVQARYRFSGQPSYSSLSMRRTEEGGWRAEVPGEVTAGERPRVLEFYIATVDDAEVELLVIGSADEPLRVAIAPGQLEIPTTPLYEERWFWGILATAVVIGGAAAFIINAETSALPDSPFGPPVKFEAQ